METFFGSVLAFLFGVGSGSSLGLLSTVLVAEAIGQNVFCAVVPFALLHTAIFNTALTVAAEMRLEFDRLPWRELERMIPGFLVMLFNTLRHAEPLTIIGGVIMSLDLCAFALQGSKNIIFFWGLVITTASEMRTPKTALLIIITGLTVMAFGSTDGQQMYTIIVTCILVTLLILPFVIIYLGYVIVQNVPISGLSAIAAALALINFDRPQIYSFFSHIKSQYLALINAILTAVAVFNGIIIFSFIIALLVIMLLFFVPYVLWGDAAAIVFVLPFSLAAAVAIVCWQGAVGPAAFIFPAAFIYHVEFDRSQFSSLITVFSALVSFLVAESNIWSVEVNLKANNVLNILILVLELVAMFHVACTLAIIFGIAVSMRAQNPGMEAKGGLLCAWALIGASLAAALAVQMVHGTVVLLKGLAVSVLILLGFCIILKIIMQRVNICEAVKQFGSMYVATFVIGLGVALPAWIGWTCILIGVFLPIKTLRMNPLPVQEVQEDTDEEVEEEEDEAYEDDGTEDD